MTDGPATLRVATWNIRAAIGPEKPFPDRWWRLISANRLRAMGELLEGLDLDLVALQEVALASRDGELLDNAGDLGRQLGMDVRFGGTRTFSMTDAAGEMRGAGCFGNAILSRLPIRSSTAVQLPMAPSDAYVEPPDSGREAAGVRYRDAPAGVREPRTLLIARVDEITVASTHFSHNGAAERALQATATVAAMGVSGRALLLADLNAAIEAHELAGFGDWVDGLSAAGVPPGDSRRISTDDGSRIDHVLGREVSVQNCRVLRESGDLSDHYPIVAEIRVGSGR